MRVYWIFCNSDAITIQPTNDGKLNPFNADWSNDFFKSVSDVKEGKFDCLIS